MTIQLASFVAQVKSLFRFLSHLHIIVVTCTTFGAHNYWYNNNYVHQHTCTCAHVFTVSSLSCNLCLCPVPPPTVVVQPVNPSVLMVSGTARNLTCTVTLAHVNDISVAVDFTWISNMTELNSTNRITPYLTSQSENLSTFTSTLIFFPLDDSVDNGTYRCNVSVDSDPSSVFITPTTATNTTRIDVQRE